MVTHSGQRGLRVIFMGSPDFAVSTLKGLMSTVDVVGVVAQPDRPSGRGRKLTPCPVKVVALAAGIPVFTPTRLRKDPMVLDALARLAPDLIVVVAYGQILPREVLAMPRLGCVNVHASLLPKYRGAAPITWAIAHGEPETGVTLMQMDEGLDTGPMLATAKLPIGEGDIAGTLATRLAELGANLLVSALPDLAAGKLAPTPQPALAPELAHMAYARLLKKTDGLVDFARSAVEVRNHIAAMDPWPGAYVDQPGGALKLFSARLATAAGLLEEPSGTAELARSSSTFRRPSPGSPGAVMGADDHGLVIACGADGASGRATFVSVGELQGPGRKRMPAAAFLAGAPFAPGTILGQPSGGG